MSSRNLWKILCFSSLVLFAASSTAQDLSTIKEAKPLTLNGSIGLNTSLYSVNGIEGRQAPWAYGVNANATLSLYGIAMPFSFSWYNNNKEGKYSQPFNQFGISPTYKWLTMHLGYRNMSFSEFTLNGYTFLGAGVEANPGKFRLGAMYGKFNQNSVFNLAMADSVPRLTRTGWAAKVGYGTPTSFVDVSLLRIGDNADKFVNSTQSSEMPTPEENLAIGLTSRLALSKKLSFHFDGSYSVLTHNTVLAQMDTTDHAILRLAGNLIEVNGSTDYFKAFKTGLNYRFSAGTVLGIEYRRIDPGFRSMGSYFFNNDVEHITFNQSLALLENKMNLRGSLGMQRDNLNEEKANTARRVIGALSGSYAPDQHWHIDASFNNFSTNQRAFKTANKDSILVFQVNRNISLMPRYMKANEKMSHMVMLMLNMSTLEDKNQQTANMTNTNTYMAMLMYNLGLPAWKANLSAGLNYTQMSNLNFENRLTGGNINLTKMLLEDKLSVGFNNNITRNLLNDDSGLIINSALNALYRIHSQHSVTLNINLISNRFAEGAAVPSYNETRGDISYVFTF